MRGIYLVTVEALPAPGSQAFEEFGGAYVNVYLEEHSEGSARAAAQREIEDAGWICKAIEKVAYVTREDFADDPDGAANFDQALIDGATLVFHTFPIGPDDEDVVH